MSMEYSKKYNTPEQVEEVEAILDYTFQDKELLKRAFRHKGTNVFDHYETLEFLGDRVWGAIAAEQLYRIHPKASPKTMSEGIIPLIGNDFLGHICINLNLNEYIEMPKGYAPKRGKIPADVIEATIAAIFLDGGYEAARKAAYHLMEKSREKQQSLEDKMFSGIFNNSSFDRLSETPVHKLAILADKKKLAPPSYCFNENAKNKEARHRAVVSIEGVDVHFETSDQKKTRAKNGAAQLMLSYILS